MRAALSDIAARLGVVDDDAQVLHMANNAVYALPGASIVVRITRSTKLHERIRKGARLGSWFAEVDAPTIRLTGAIPQPLTIEDLLATVWDYIPPAPTPSPEDLGKVLKEFHSLPAPDFDLPRWDPVGTARKRIADAEALEDTDRASLLDWCDRLEPEVDALVTESEGSLIHGDAHVGNLLRRPDGRVVLCDFDSTCLGPSGVDLAAVAAAAIWFTDSGEHARLAASYGHDITTDPAWPVLRQARELTFVVGGVPLMASTPGVAEEFKLRLATVMTGDTSTPWTPYAAFGNSDR
ncbi:aminoglycoside phosphotransferase family protein [Glycomyces xiaoerkulensis]|uniref:aminoglycoside phosphotransferase family protein n=1 Tax=Glycomyces xiaoerkulensis TaxID=2038139 RepID=UPI000C25B676